MWTIEPMWACGQLLMVIGLGGVHRSGAAGGTRSASVGMNMAIVGAAGIGACELVLTVFRTQRIDDTGPGIVLALFGLFSVTQAIGLVVAGRTALKSGRWGRWRRLTVLAAGVWSVALIGLQFTALLPSAAGRSTGSACSRSLLRSSNPNVPPGRGRPGWVREGRSGGGGGFRGRRRVRGIDVELDLVLAGIERVHTGGERGALGDALDRYSRGLEVAHDGFELIQ